MLQCAIYRQENYCFLNKLLQCQLQSCSIDFIKAGFQFTVENSWRSRKVDSAGEGNACNMKERQFGQGLYISVLIL